jgi:hypothetical protein
MQHSVCLSSSKRILCPCPCVQAAYEGLRVGQIYHQVGGSETGPSHIKQAPSMHEPAPIVLLAELLYRQYRSLSRPRRHLVAA